MQVPKNLGGHIKMARGIIAKNHGAATTDGTGIDRMAAGSQEGFRSAVVLLDVGAASGTPDSFTAIFKLQDSADNSTFADLSAAVYAEAGLSAAAFTTITASGTAEYDINLQPLRRYIRISVTCTLTGGSSPALPVCASIALGGAMVAPPA